MEKKKYIKPTTVIVSVKEEAPLASGSPTKVTSYRRWYGELPTTKQEWGIVDARAEAVFVHGQSASGGGNRSKSNPWSAWDE